VGKKSGVIRNSAETVERRMSIIKKKMI